MISIKEQIGKRIAFSRQQRGWTLQELADKTNGHLSSARISNWEQGRRTPGVEEASVLGAILGVSPSYLLCLSDSSELKIFKSQCEIHSTVPLIAWKELKELEPLDINEIAQLKNRAKNTDFIALDEKTEKKLEASTRALCINDRSMEPDFKKDNLIIVNLNQKPEHEQYVIAKLLDSDTFVFRQYRSKGADDHRAQRFDLLALNTNFESYLNMSYRKAKVIAVAIEYRNYL